jgi:hypothetical protein
MESPQNDGAVFRPSHKPWKSIKPIPTFPPPRLPRDIYDKIPRKETSEAARANSTLQAHSWIGKDFDSNLADLASPSLTLFFFSSQ